MLHTGDQTTISDYSKGSWGLSVLLRVSGIFTGTTTSPRSTLRQCPDHYTIRAGRNLPDKEFRYLRTVIVTADIHGGLGPELAPQTFTFPHWSLVTPYTSCCHLAESYVFAKQSVGTCHCGHAEAWHPLSRSYGVNLPSSLERVNSRALEYSSHLPVSVYGTGTS